jgi:glycosyltransferase involved in cell wall biosynthesis
MKPILYIVIPCYNEEAVLPVTAPSFKQKIESLVAGGKISEDSKILFVNDGSRDNTWQIICDLAEKQPDLTSRFHILRNVSRVLTKGKKCGFPKRKV